jgi:hypothetical protein
MNHRKYIPRTQARIITPPTTLPISAADACNELNLPLSEAPRVERVIRTATELAEAFTNRSFITRTLQLQLDAFPNGTIPWWDGVRQGSIRQFTRDAFIALPKPPAIALTSFQYINLANQLTTVNTSTYYLDSINEPARIILNYGSSWPSDARDRAAVLITYTAGYGATSASLPSAIIDAILMHTRDQINRPNGTIESETIDNASVTYGGRTDGTAGVTGGLRADAAALLQPYRFLETGV